MLYLTEDDVEGLLTMPDALNAVEDALRALGRGEAVNRPRQRVRLPKAMLHVMAAGWPARGYYGFKDYSSTKGQTRFWFHLFDGETGDLVAVLQADRLGQQRTGAATGVATKHLARKDAATVGIVGTGWQAESQLEAVCAVRPVQKIRCFGRDAARRDRFASEMASRLDVDVRPAVSTEKTVRDADIVIAATSAREPVVKGEWLAPGVHVNAIGANRIEARELDDEAIRKAELIVTDSVEQARMEGGDLVEPVSHGLLSWDRVHEIGDVVAGKVAGRTRDGQVTLFKSQGIAIEDVAVGALVYERARAKGIGRELPL